MGDVQKIDFCRFCFIKFTFPNFATRYTLNSVLNIPMGPEGVRDEKNCFVQAMQLKLAIPDLLHSEKMKD
jgi:hypothetical protein